MRALNRLTQRHRRRKRLEDSRSDLNTLEQLVNLFVRHLLTELCEDVAKLSGTNEAISFLVEYLEATDEFLCD